MFPSLFVLLYGGAFTRGLSAADRPPGRPQGRPRRGREAGEFDDGLPLDWQIAVTVKLGHAASEEVDAGRLSEEEATRTLRTTLLRVLRADR